MTEAGRYRCGKFAAVSFRVVMLLLLEGPRVFSDLNIASMKAASLGTLGLDVSFKREPSHHTRHLSFVQQRFPIPRHGTSLIECWLVADGPVLPHLPPVSQ